MKAKPLNILITGAASGLGRSLALLLAREEHSILLTDRNEAGLRETADDLGAVNWKFPTHVLDVTSAADIDRFSNELSTHRIDVLINNAGLQHVAPIESFPDYRWDTLID